MNEVDSLVATLVDAQIDSNRHFIAEEFTPLYHTSIYRSLTADVRRRYNQLHALYFNEQIAFFEREMLAPSLQGLLRLPLPQKLAKGLKEFAEEERRHTAMFQGLNRRAAPELYQDRATFFVRVSQLHLSVVCRMTRYPRAFPLFVWLALLLEERSVYYSKTCHACADQLEPHFAAVHRAHLADEIGHLQWDEELLDWLWPRTPFLFRGLNARLLAWMVAEFFLFPKRSAVRVVDQLVSEHPTLDRAALLWAVRDLQTDARYRSTQYSRDIVPRTFSRIAIHSEFAPLAKILMPPLAAA